MSAADSLRRPGNSDRPPGLNLVQLRELIVRPVLEVLKMHSPAAEDLVMGTALQESLCFFLRQIPNGPALGLWQMEPATHDDIWDSWLRFRPQVAILVSAHRPPANRMIGDLYYAAAMCRVHYSRRSEPLPAAGDVDGYAAYWKQHYNTPAGAGTPEEFAHKFNDYLAPKGN